VVNNCIEKNNWNIDNFDGVGTSKANINFTKVQLMIIDFGWLGVASVRVGFFINKEYVYAHSFNHTNSNTTVYMSTPNLPLRSEIQNLGSGPVDTLTQICSSVESEGGSQENGQKRYYSTSGIHLDLATEDTLYAVLGMKLRPEYIGATINQLYTWVQLQTASHKLEWVIIYDPDSVSGTFTYTGLKQSSVMMAKGSGTNKCYGGYQIDGGTVESGGVASGASGRGGNSSIQNALRLSSKIDGTVIPIIFCVKPIGGSSNIDVEAGMSWREMN
jgi:hypothetical protein